MNKKAKIYSVLLVVAGGAWVCDRMMPGGGVTAPAVSEASMATAAAAPAAAAPKAPAESLAQRFSRAGKEAPADASAGYDLFSPPEEWLPKAAPAAAPVAAPVYDVATFEKNHKLTAVIRTRDQDRVMLDGRIVAVGQKLDGLTLVATTESTATFRGQGAEVTLRLPLTPEDVASPEKIRK